MMHLNAEMRFFARSLGRKLNKFDPDSAAAFEYTDIAEGRLSQLLGMERDAPAFREIWGAVFDAACEGIEDDSPDLLPGDTAPSEEELEGLPYRCWRIGVLGEMEQEMMEIAIEARTAEEAVRIIEARRIPGRNGYTVLEIGRAAG